MLKPLRYAARSKDDPANGAGSRPDRLSSWRARDRTTILNSVSPSCYRIDCQRKVSAAQARRRTGCRRRHAPASRARRTSDGDDSTRFIALIGAPNAGKSTLLNALVGSRSASSLRARSDHARIDPRHRHRRSGPAYFCRHAWNIFAAAQARSRDGRRRRTGAHEADLVGVLIDARNGTEVEGKSFAGLATLRPRVLILNKIDAVSKESCRVCEGCQRAAKFEATFMVSARRAMVSAI